MASDSWYGACHCQMHKFYEVSLRSWAAIGKAIEKGMQEGLSAGITHGIEGRTLTYITAYNPSTEADYLAALHHLQSVNFSLLAELKSNKDASTEAIMNLLWLEDHLADRLGLTASQPHADQLMVPIHHSLDHRVIGASALSLSLDVSNFRVQKIKENLANRVSALHNIFIPLFEPLSVTVLTGTEGTSAVVHALEASSAGLQEKKLDADVVAMVLHLEEKFYPHLLNTIAGRRWLLTHGMELAIAKCLNSTEYLSALGAAIGKAIEKGMQEGLSAGITHGIEGRTLTDIAAYNPYAEADYLAALHHLQSVNFSLLAELKSNKDASTETIMNLIRLEDHLADRLGLTASQPRADQLMVPIHSPDHRVIRAFALSLSLDVFNFRVQKIKENLANRVSALHNIFIPLSEPLSVMDLTGMEGTSAVVAIPAGTTTTLSVTFASASVVRPISIDDYEIVQVDGQRGGGTKDQIKGNNVDPFPSIDDVDLNLQ
ncbi:hypothetical protein Tco_0348264 [Tanacetum coccineum]